MDVQAAVSRVPGQAFSIERLTLDDPRDDEILIRVAGVGLCHTDLIARDGFIPVPQPAVFGHEGSGEVVAVGAAIRTVRPGDKVVMTFGSCGVCKRCTHGDSPYCEMSGAINYSGGRLDGSKALHAGDEPVSSHFFGQSSFASMVLAYERNVIVVSPDIDIALLGPLGCGVQTGAGAVFNTLGCTAGSSLLISGGGSLGLSAVMAAVVQGCEQIIVIEPHAARRALALELGATHVIDPMAGSTVEAVRAIAPAGVDFAFDSTGLSAVIDTVLQVLGMRGVLAVAGVPPTPESVASVPILSLVGAGQTVKGLVEGDSDPTELIPRMIALHKDGRFPFDRLITTYRLDQINEAVSDHHAGKCVKAVLLPEHA